MRQFEAKILINTLIAPNLMQMAFEWPDDLVAPEPGQFFTVLPPMVEIGAGTLLRRPLAFAAFDPGGEDSWSRMGAAAPGVSSTRDGRVAAAHSIYQIRGAGTKALAALRPGTSINVIGPLGNSFPKPKGNETAVIAGGGIGIGPMLFLAASLRARGLPYRLVAGFRSAAMVPFQNVVILPPHGAAPADGASPTDSAASTDGAASLWRQLLERATISTDDGSLGVKGTVLDALARLEAASPSSERWHLYGCGPGPMLAALARFATPRRAAAHFSAEQWMACGVGACHGCVVPAAAGGYLRVCADGPVFEAGVIDWEASVR